jgi:methylglutaconyl-CoA hydratase
MMALSLRGDFTDAQKALDIGLVHQIASDSLMQADLDQLVDDLLKGGPRAQKSCKKLFHELNGVPQNALSITAQSIARVRAGDEAREGLDAFASKRSPHWCSSPGKKE